MTRLQYLGLLGVAVFLIMATGAYVIACCIEMVRSLREGLD